MKKPSPRLFWLLAVVAGGSLSLALPTMAQTQPNIIIMLMDDMGVNDIGAYTYPSKASPGPPPASVSGGSGTTDVPPPNPAHDPGAASLSITPRIDSLADGGARFTQFYSTHTVCTPTRASLMAGCYAPRVGLEVVVGPYDNNINRSDRGLNSTEVTLAELLRERGYKTAMSGKWHMGHDPDFNPVRHGFESYFGILYSNDMWEPNTRNDWGPLDLMDGESTLDTYTTDSGKTITHQIDTDAEQSYLLEAMTDEAVDFIDEAVTDGSPFFLYYAPHTPHVPIHPHPDFLSVAGQTDPIARYYDLIREIDTRVGEILDRLTHHRIADNTIVIFTSDNGPSQLSSRYQAGELPGGCGSAYPFRGYKANTGEGGLRVPFLAKFPGHIAAGTVYHEAGMTFDLYTTLANLAGATIPSDRDVDGVDLWPLLSGSSTAEPHDAFYFYGGSDPATAEAVSDLSTADKWKYTEISGTTGQLFKIGDGFTGDFQEISDVGGANAAIKTSLNNQLDSWNTNLTTREIGWKRGLSIEVENDRVTVDEDGTATTRIRLSGSATQTIHVGFFSGDSDLGVTGGATVNFDSGNWNTWQTVTFAFTPDPDTENGAAVFRAYGNNIGSSSDIHVREIFVFENDTMVASGTTYSADVVVYGATSGGIISAVQAVNEGKTVELVEPTTHIGGTTTGGLGWVDDGITSSIGGLSYEFFNKVAKPSASPIPTGFSSGSNQWTVIPSEALAEFQAMLAAKSITVRTGNRLVRGGGGVVKSGASITKIHMENGNIFQGKIFIDATYEGDLMAEAGVSYRVGRESSAEYGEALAGVVGPTIWQPQQFDYFIDPYVTPGDPNSGLLPYIQEGPLAATGSADDKTQAYNFRLCLTRSTDPAKRVEITEPPGYDPAKYEILRRYIAARTAAGQTTVLRTHLLKISALYKDLKTDINNVGPFSTDHIGQNWEYPDGSYATRDAIIQEHINFTKGLLWFLKSDPAIPAQIRTDMAAFAYPADEYTTNGNFSPQMYVREARRLLGPHVMTEADIETNDTKTDAIGQGSYGVDSHHVQRLIFPADYPASPGSRTDTPPYDRNSAGQLQNEGNFLAEANVYDIPYRAITPQKAECDNLLVTFCVSASHIAFGSIRMEPVFMLLGQSAATAAAMAIDQGVAVQDIDYQTLRAKLKADGQVFSTAGEPTVIATEYFNGYGDTDKAFVNSYFDSNSGGTGWGSDWGDTTEVINNSKYIEANGYTVGDNLTYSGTGYSNAGNLPGDNDGAAGYMGGTDGAGTYSFSAREFSTASTASTIWFSVLVNAGTAENNAVLWIDAENASGLYGGRNGFGILNGDLFMRTQVEGGDSTTRVDVTGSAAGTGSTTYLMLAKAELNYSGSFDRLSVWTDPDLSSGESSLGSPGTFLNEGRNLFGTSMTGISVQTAGDSNVDAIRVGTTLESVLIPETPAAPTNLQSTAVSGTAINLAWTDASTNETGFKIRRSTISGSGFVTIHTTAANATSFSDTGLEAGTTYFYEVVATNGSDDSAPGNEASATTWTPAEVWRAFFFGQTANTGDAADGNDFDQGGAENLLERAFGTDPTDASDDNSTEISMVEVSGTEYPAITYRRLKGGSGTTGVDYTKDGIVWKVEHDTDLADLWSTGSVAAVGDPVDNGDGTESVTVRLTTPVSALDRVFIRLKIAPWQ